MKKAGKFVQICTTIPEEIYFEVINQKWKHSEIYKLGYITKIDGGQDKKALNELRMENEKLIGKVSRLAGRIFALEEEKHNEN